jgi:putative endopeptidase
LSQSWDDEDFSFAKVLSGQQEERPRWKRVLDSQDHAMGMILGRIFVQEYFPAPTKQRYVNLVEAIRSAYRDRIHRLNWMSDETKAKALEKLAKMKAKVGYPDHWKDYSTLLISTNSYCENMMNASRWHYNDMISKFGKPVDRTEWDMNPQTYNAYYDDANNEIVLPAAIFTVPGKSDDQLDDALVYGYAAAGTIGHEITHGFDDEGRKFDANGNLEDWSRNSTATNPCPVFTSMAMPASAKTSPIMAACCWDSMPSRKPNNTAKENPSLVLLPCNVISSATPWAGSTTNAMKTCANNF